MTPRQWRRFISWACLSVGLPATTYLSVFVLSWLAGIPVSVIAVLARGDVLLLALAHLAFGFLASDMITDNTLYWLMIAPVAFFLFCLASFLHSLRHEKPRRQDGDAETPSLDESELPHDLHHALHEIRTRGGHVEVTRLNGKVAVLLEPSEMYSHTASEPATVPPEESL